MPFEDKGLIFLVAHAKFYNPRTTQKEKETNDDNTDVLNNDRVDDSEKNMVQSFQFLMIRLTFPRP